MQPILNPVNVQPSVQPNYQKAVEYAVNGAISQIASIISYSSSLSCIISASCCPCVPFSWICQICETIETCNYPESDYETLDRCIFQYRDRRLDRPIANAPGEACCFQIANVALSAGEKLQSLADRYWQEAHKALYPEEN